MATWRGRDISSVLSEEIAQLESGAKVPSEHDIVFRFGVPRSVARNVIADLESRFLVRRVRGSGTYVNKRVDYIISNNQPPSMHATVESANGTARTFLLDSGVLPPSVEVAELLKIPTDIPVTRLCRIGYINDAISSYSEEWFAPGVAEDIDAALGVIESVYEVLCAYRYSPRRRWSRATIASPPPYIQQRLDLDSPVPTWVVESVTTESTTANTLMVSRTWTRQDSVRMVFEYELGAT